MAEESIVAPTFRERMEAFTAVNGWVPHDLNEKRIILKFDLASGRTQTLYAIDMGTVVEFSVPSSFEYDTTKHVPPGLALNCLRRSAKTRVGFWCLEKIAGRKVLSIMWNLPHRQIDNEIFGEVVRALVVGCDELESELSGQGSE